MKYLIIGVPDKNDSMSRIVLDGTVYYIRFTYNSSGDCWRLGLYDHLKNVLVQGIKITPNIAVNKFLRRDKLPKGSFGVIANSDRLGRKSFTNEGAKFVYIPAGE